MCTKIIEIIVFNIDLHRKMNQVSMMDGPKLKHLIFMIVKLSQIQLSLNNKPGIMISQAYSSSLRMIISNSVSIKIFNLLNVEEIYLKTMNLKSEEV